MKKRFMAVLLVVAMAATMMTGCGKKGPEDNIINLWAFTDEVPKMVDEFLKANPDFGYEVNTTIIATTDGA